MHKRIPQRTTSTILEKVQKEYSVLAGGTPVFSLVQLFSFEGFRLDEYCQVFSPHPQTQQLLQETRNFGERYGIWTPAAEHYISYASYLYPDGAIDRMRAIMKNLAIDYYLNDAMGRDVFHGLSPEEQKTGTDLRDRMFRVKEDLNIEGNATSLELANIEVLNFISDSSPFSWFKEFLRLYNYHIHVTHKDCNVNAMGRIATVDEYIDSRCHMAGMHHVISLIEYSEGCFLDWEWLANAGIDKQLRRLHYITAAIGGLMNDLFSFEKEVIANHADSNLVMIILYNKPQLALTSAIERAAVLVRSLLIEFVGLLEYIKEEAEQCISMCPEKVQVMRAHFKGLERCVQASWIWQVYTPRYKTAYSVFRETRLNDMVSAG
jgi:hypothetical protein